MTIRRLHPLGSLQSCSSRMRTLMVHRHLCLRLSVLHSVQTLSLKTYSRARSASWVEPFAVGGLARAIARVTPGFDVREARRRRRRRL